MRNLIAAVFCIALLASCTEGFESTIDMTTTQPKTEQTGVNRAYWDADEAMRIDLMWVSRDLIVSHYELDYFRAVLTNEQLDAVDNMSEKNLLCDLDMAVSIIYAWFMDGECFDVMCEDSTWDSFKELVLQLDEYRELFKIYYEDAE